MDIILCTLYMPIYALEQYNIIRHISIAFIQFKKMIQYI